MTLLKYSGGTSSAAAVGARSRRRGNTGGSAEDGHTNIYIDVDDDCAVTLGPEIAESLSNESVGNTGYRKQVCMNLNSSSVCVSEHLVEVSVLLFSPTLVTATVVFIGICSVYCYYFV